MKDSQLPENVELLRTRVVIEKDRVFSVRFIIQKKRIGDNLHTYTMCQKKQQVSGSDYPNQYPGIGNGFNLEEFKKVKLRDRDIKWRKKN
jgi:DNA-directed RNA polymerase I and III subunit RPAC1